MPKLTKTDTPGIFRRRSVESVYRIGEAETEDQKRAKALTGEGLRLLLAALPEDQRLFFEFLAFTGPRIGEAVGLTWENLDLGERPKRLDALRRAAT
jgi:integrase